MIPYYEQKQQHLYGNIASMKFFPPHLHAHLELIYVRQGSVSIDVNGVNYILNENDFAVVFPNTIHSYSTSFIKNETMMLICSPELVGEYFNKMTTYSPKNSIIKKEFIHEDVKYALNSLYNEAKNSPNLNISSKKALTELILSRIFPYLELQKNITSMDGDVASRVISYICDNFKKELSLDIISHELGVNKFYISRIFTNKIGVSFNDYINNLRVDFSKKLLQNSNLPILEVSNECGFETQRTFNRIFKKLAGTTPMEYRAKKF